MKNQNEFRIFSKKHVPLYLFAALALILPFLILLLIFTDGFKDVSKITDFSAWGSIVAGIVTYIGAALLGIVSYYNTWLNQYRAERLDYSIEYSPVYDGRMRNFFDLNEFPENERRYSYEILEKDCESFEIKSYGYKRLVINNFNSTYPMNIQILKAELSVDGAPFADCTNDVGMETDFDLFGSIEYKANNVLLLGVSKALLKYRRDTENHHTHSFNAYFRISNSRNAEICKLSILSNDSQTSLERISGEEAKQIKYNSVIHRHL